MERASEVVYRRGQCEDGEVVQLADHEPYNTSGSIIQHLSYDNHVLTWTMYLH